MKYTKAELAKLENTKPAMEMDPKNETIDKLQKSQITPEMAKDIANQKIENKFIFQIISKENGKRSEPFVTNWSELYTILSQAEEQNIHDYILLVAVLQGDETIVPGTPLITIETFLEYHLEQTTCQSA